MVERTVLRHNIIAKLWNYNRVPSTVITYVLRKNFNLILRVYIRIFQVRDKLWGSSTFTNLSYAQYISISSAFWMCTNPMHAKSPVRILEQFSYGRICLIFPIRFFELYGKDFVRHKSVRFKFNFLLTILVNYTLECLTPKYNVLRKFGKDFI